MAKAKSTRKKNGKASEPRVSVLVDALDELNVIRHTGRVLQMAIENENYNQDYAGSAIVLLNGILIPLDEIYERLNQLHEQGATP